MYDSDIADFLPKLGGKVRTEKGLTIRRSMLRHIDGSAGRKSMFSKTGGHPKRGSRASHVRSPKTFSQRCVVKARVIKMGPEGKKAARLHLDYITRDGVEKDGSGGNLFGREGEIDKKDFSSEIKEEPHQFRFIVSPENAKDLDLTEFTKKLMAQMEKDLGRKLDWAAVNHYNTDNPHSHIVVRGLDANGHEVRMDREYISNGIRNRAVEIATNELGLRTEYDLEMQYKRDIKADRFTSLDYKIDCKAQESPSKNFVDLGVYPKNQYARAEQIRLAARLNNLESLGLADKVKNRAWKLKDGWQQSLKDLGVRNDIIKTMHRQLQGDPARYHVVGDNTKPMQIEGRLTSKGLSNELYDKFFLVVEAPNGHSYYVNAHRGMALDELKEGNIVSLKVERDRWLKRADLNISAIARKNEGIYSEELHLKSIGSDKIKVKDYSSDENRINYKEIYAKDFVKSHGRRLYKLRQFGFAKKLDDGSWSVDESFVDELSKRDRETPLSKVKVNNLSDLSVDDQVNYKGPAWIDKFSSNDFDDSLSKHGFGSDVSRCARLRRMFLMDMELDLEGEALNKKLERIELDENGKKFSRSKKMVFRPVQPDLRFKGRLSPLKLKSGKILAAVSDSRSKEFTLVPWKKQYGKAVGENVDIHIDGSGNIDMKRIVKAVGR